MTVPDHAQEIERLVERAARDPRTHTFARLADLYRKAGELERALEVIEGGLQHHPHYLNARLVHARLLRELGRPAEARAAFEHVLRIDSENLVAQSALAELDAETGKGWTAEGGGAASPGAGGGADMASGSTGWLARLDDDWQRERASNGGATRDRDADGEVGPLRPESAGSRESARAPGPNLEATGPSEAAGPSEPEAPDPPRPEAARPPEPEAARPPEPEAARPPEPEEEDDGERELETATLAALYARQGLFDRAIGIYERLLARDPYNARLAAALEEARRRTTPADSAPPERAERRRIPTPEATPPTETAETPDGSAAPPSASVSTPIAGPAGAGGARAAVEPADDAASMPIRDFLRALLDGRAPTRRRRGPAPGEWPVWLARRAEGDD